MLGIELKLKDKVFHLPIEAGPTVTIRNIDGDERAWIDVGLYHAASNKVVKWANDVELSVNERVSMSIEEIDFVSMPIVVYDFHKSFGTTKEENDKKKVERYYELKAKLQDKGLI